MTQPYLTDEAEIDEHNAMTAVRKVIADLRANPCDYSTRISAANFLTVSAHLSPLYKGELFEFAQAILDAERDEVDINEVIADYAPDFDTWEEAVQLKAMGE